MLERPLPWPPEVELGALRPKDPSVRVQLQLVTPAGRAGPREPIGVRYVRTRPWSGEMEPRVIPGLALPARRMSHLLICTHGARDTCCGALGTRLAAGLEALSPGMTLWRTSHLGAHRFAPTALILPSGTMWGRLDDRLIHGIVDETLDPIEGAKHYRGCIGIDGPEFQLADRAGLERHGWEWLRLGRRCTVIEAMPDRMTVLIEGHRNTNAIRSIRATVERTGTVPIPLCGAPVETPHKFQPVFVVSDVHAT